MKSDAPSHPSRRRLRGLAVIAALALFAGGAVGGDLLRLAVPLGLPEDTWKYYVPPSNPLTGPKIALGRRLFFDARLSSDGTISCATCHDPQAAFADHKPVAEGVGGRRGTRNSPSLLNVIFGTGQFWDGRADTLEEQATQPLTNPVEMGNASVAAVVARLNQVPEYEQGFRVVFGQPATAKSLAQALAAYERTLVSGDAPLDRYLAGDLQAMSAEALRGFAVFRGKGRCARCHTFNQLTPFFTDFAYHNTGVAANHPAFQQLARRAVELLQRPEAEAALSALGREAGGDELGRVLITRQPFDIGSFKTPSLRNVALTAPYFHDGSARALADVVRFYNGGGRANLNREAELDPLSLTEAEQRDLVTFLESLTGNTPTSLK